MKFSKVLPFFAKGKVVKGFGRGSKQLGIPTANFPQDVVNALPESLETGVYYGWASVDAGPVYKMVLSVGWNPHFHNSVKTMETHILHQFDEDFYGHNLRIAIVGFIREMREFSSLDALISAIQSDIAFAKQQLDTDESRRVSGHPFFREALAPSEFPDGKKTPVCA